MAVDDGTRSELLADVVSRYDGMSDRRLQEVVTSAIRHLHAFVADVGLTHDEWMAGIRFLTEVGKTCDDVRQEFILLSDTLGVSTLVERIDYDAAAGATENTVLGPRSTRRPPPSGRTERPRWRIPTTAIGSSSAGA